MDYQSDRLEQYIWEGVDTTLNLLLQARLHLQLSEYYEIWGALDYNRTPLAPPCTHFLVHDKPK